MRGRTWALMAALAVAAPATAGANNKKQIPKRVGFEPVASLEPKRGFVDDPFAFDGAGGRLVYVNADAGELTELHVVDLTQKGARLATIDISAFTTTPVAVDFVLDGEHFFVVSRKTEGVPAEGALIDKRGKVVRTFGPATEVVLTSWQDTPAVVTYHRGSVKGGQTRHQVEVRALDSGRRLGKKTELVTDDSGRAAKQEFRLGYWADGFTRAVGVKGGSWNRKEDQRSPDYEAEYVLPDQRFRKRVDIRNPMAHVKRMQLMGEHHNRGRFAAVATDLSGVTLVEEGAEPVALSLALPFHRYGHKSLQQHLDANGDLFFTLTIDPVNPDAVARKKADIVYLDLYRVKAGSTNAERVGRLRVDDKRAYTWRASGDHFALVPRHVGFGRGGKTLEVYAIRK